MVNGRSQGSGRNRGKRHKGKEAKKETMQRHFERTSGSKSTPYRNTASFSYEGTREK
jgi:hypothetical protein